jgi:hypothetical protein
MWPQSPPAEPEWDGYCWTTPSGFKYAPGGCSSAAMLEDMEELVLRGNITKDDFFALAGVDRGVEQNGGQDDRTT